MATLEEEAKRERRRGYLQKAVLNTIGVAGMMAVAVVAPNVLQVSGRFGLGRRGRFIEQAEKATARLVRKGYIKFEERKGKKYLRLTNAGKLFLQRAEWEERLRTSLLKKRTWDRRWRMVVFDIAERRKESRRKLRQMLRSFNFLRIQDSVWVYPYDCEEVVVLLKAELRIGKEVLYAIVEKIENDGWIRKHFGLKN